MSEKQVVGIDVGRGFVKYYSKFGESEISGRFNAVLGTGRNGIKYSAWENPIALTINGNLLFFGELAIKESMNQSSNIKDEKDSFVSEMLLVAALSKVAKTKNVKILLGVPNRMYNKRTLETVITKYKGKTYRFKDDVTKENREVYIADISIFREGDAALVYMQRGQTNKKPVGLVSIGFRTTEFSYYEPGLRFIDRKSTSIGVGARDVLEETRKMLEEERIYKTVEELDITSVYDDKKEMGYNFIATKIEQEIDSLWVNLSEMENIYLCGGTSYKVDLNPSIFNRIDDPQMATAKGLYYMAVRKFAYEKEK